MATGSYNAPMNKAARFFLLSCCAFSLHAMAEDFAQPPAIRYGGPENGAVRPLSPGQGMDRMERREERRQRHEAWRQMSPEERHRLRSDIRDAGRSIYSGRQRGRE